jgi:phage-related tail protein
VSASGAGAAMQKYAQDLMNSGTAASQTRGDYQAVMGDLEKLGLSAQQAAALIAQVTQNLHNAAGHYTATLTVYTNYVTSGGGASMGINPGASGLPKVGGHAAGTPSAPSGWAWVGEAGPELVKFRGGEQVLPNQVSMGFANGTGGPYGAEFHIYLDGRELNAAISQRAIQAQRRTGTNGMQKRTR